MAILSKKEKLKLVRRYIGGQYVPTPDDFRSRTSFKASLLNWVKRYRLCGEKGLERKKRKRIGEPTKRQSSGAACRGTEQGPRGGIRRLLRSGVQLVPVLFTIRKEHGKVHR